MADAQISFNVYKQIGLKMMKFRIFRACGDRQIRDIGE
jgi:hypothetical protein